ncbi:LRR receptor-like serine threonine-protein kinase [Seminavis robusta]|uniref:LRR receptor-like serine threonine-protein kinase n=1 Tax=Seminavis robusta TaxID=568900 RepID=A0A9N8EUS5_9STRA|nr:LRR receptor-like serine threonine-protein kinase [Seminavis robusta]|eukprot:Sro1631_g287250.1 LRR receptor-like serine threonine-protein kinase (834) ;mRNA; f:16965-19553
MEGKTEACGLVIEKDDEAHSSELLSVLVEKGTIGLTPRIPSSEMRVRNITTISSRASTKQKVTNDQPSNGKKTTQSTCGNGQDANDIGPTMVVDRQLGEDTQDIQEATSPAASSLARGGDIEHLPGAFASVPGSSHVRQDAVQFSLMGREQNASDCSHASSIAGNNQEQHGLSEAFPVDDIEAANLPGAVPVDHAAEEAKKLNRDWQLKKLGLLGLLGILLVVSLTTVLSSTLSGKETVVNDLIDVPATQVPTDPPSHTTLSPSPASTFLIPNDMLLSTTTSSALLNPLSPQSKAFLWLLDHPDVKTMEMWRKVQLFALATFFYSFHGEDWLDVVRTDFVAYGKSECDWYSRIYGSLLYHFGEQKYIMTERKTNETTCNSMGNFTRLNLQFPRSMHKPHTSMPPEIALLPELEEISLSSIVFNNPMSAAVIPEMKQLTKLHTVKLAKNEISGPIPDSLFEILPSNTLEELSLNEPGLSGTIPSRINEFSNLKTLMLSGNLTGTIPSEIGSLSLMKSLTLSRNSHLNGTIPTKLFELSKMCTLKLQKTSLSGTLSSDVAELSRLSELQIDEAKLSGSIPSSLADMTGLRILTLADNELTGPLPPLNPISPFEQIRLSYNQFTGSIPTSWFDNENVAESMYSLELDENLLTGKIPEGIWSLTKLRTLVLANNLALTGQISSQQNYISSQLRIISLSNNEFYGSIPFGKMQNSNGTLTRLLLDGNYFSGNVSSEVGFLTRLADLRLSNNLELSGTIPTEISLCSSLRYLHINNTGISGSIPSELGLLSWLELLSLHDTKLSGIVPGEVCMLKEEGSLRELHINCTAVTCTCNCTCS